MTYKEWKQKNPDRYKQLKEAQRMERERRKLEANPPYNPPYWAVVIAGFPGVGKTYAAEHSEEWGFKIVDLETQDFLWEEGEDGKIHKNPNYPKNYYDKLHELLESGQDVDVILVDTKSEILDQLKKHNIRFVTVYPKTECKEEYLRRYIRASKPFPFVDTMNENWEAHMEEAKKRIKDGSDVLLLGPDCYLDEEMILNIRMQYGALRAAAMVGMGTL